MSSTITSPASVPDFPVWRMSVDYYQRMIAAGILTDEDEVELLEGCLVHQMPKNPAHRIALTSLRDFLFSKLPKGWHLEVQEAITLDDSEPEPDLAVIRGSARDYPDRHPGPADIALVVEVANTTLKTDRQLKQRIYARNGLAEYWIVNLIDRQIEVYTRPKSDDTAVAGYQDRKDYRATDELPVRIGGVDLGSIPVASILP